MSTRILYLVTDELKCHNLYSKYPLFSLTQMWICMNRPQHSVAVTLSHISVIKLNLVYERKVV